jgi:integrase/recombinase XerD
MEVYCTTPSAQSPAILIERGLLWHRGPLYTGSAMLEDAMERFLAVLRQEERRSDNTILTYAQQLHPFIQWLKDQEVTKPQDLQLKHILDFLLAEQKRDQIGPKPQSGKRLSLSSVYLKITTLRRFLFFCYEEHYIPDKLYRHLPSLRRSQRMPKTLNRREINRLLRPDKEETPDGLCIQAVLELAYASGLRISELITVDLNKLHLDAESLTVFGKGSKERVVPVGKCAIAALRRYLEVGRPALLAPGSSRRKTKRTPSSRLFLNHWGRPFIRKTLWLRIKERARARGIKKEMTPHWLRHTFATHMYRGGADLRVIQDILGHAQISTVEIYAHVDDVQMQREYFRIPGTRRAPLNDGIKA